MQLSKALSLAALTSLATARTHNSAVRSRIPPPPQKTPNPSADAASTQATFVSDNGGNFIIIPDTCTNFHEAQPIFNKMLMSARFVCELYAALDCRDGVVRKFQQGVHEIMDLRFESGRCHLVD
ncbi:hypothetical protein V494_04628 [Pseudogymnoascus sp. VKM F-4513 (FW-928)]|nr:hypothetical protein V494_04628 [Pseudogymnoascus sp. VKM F-4513 (FW-928)]